MALVEMDFSSSMGGNIVPVYSAANDLVDILSDGNVIYNIGTNKEGLGYLDVTKIDSGTYTFRSSVAKNPSSLNSLYTKEISTNLSEIRVMPDGNVLYWWGYKDKDLEALSTANGWSIYTSNYYNAPTFNTNNVYFGGVASYWGGIGLKNAVSATTLHAIGSGTTSSYKGMWLVAATTKGIDASSKVSVDITNNTYNITRYVSLDASSITNPYIFIYSGSDRYGYTYAFWYE